ncbi:ABC transporter family substrate-binding protein [Streptomyces botrytidirepellens]|uniref:ABC transporter family substrate-binding protein n=1 Tax=Streptomyces botrytidirepellens TaxID=2486417 RepID=A0A3M8VQX7_9ACTN|nr:ABC transporter family substrate-binding protein [Streptomyces botrytidirepellens]RNG18841.1 ABC transporter family substrate-binding protein [Streptomyces botrytidirepellens]
MSIDKRRCAVLLAAGVLLPLPALTGCSSGDDDGPPSPAARDIAPASRAQTAPGGTLRWALDARPATFNAFQTSADTGTERIAGAVLPALHTLDARGRPQRNGDYLESAEVVSREPKQVVVYKLNPKAVWSDGRPLGAADFSAQWKALRGTENAYWTARNAGYDRIARIQPGEKDHEVKVTFAKPYTDWRSLFTPLYPKSMMSNPAVFNAGARKGLAVTSGPFMVRAVKDTSVTLVRNPKWWGDRARLNRLVFEAVPARKRAAALVDGTLDMAEVDRSTARRIQAAEPAGKRAAGARLHPSGKAGAPKLETHGQDAADATRARAEAERVDAGKAQGSERSEAVALRRYALRTALDPAYTQLAINGAKGPLADERVRRAVARAIDRQALAKLVLKPFGLPTEPLGNHLLMSEQKGYKDHSGALGGPDTQAAQSLLADAGWRPGGSSARQKSVDGKTDERSGRSHPAVVRKKGRPLVLRFVLPSDSGGSLRAVGERIGRMLEEIGVRTEITKVKGDSFFKDHIATGKYDLALYSWPASAYPATDGRPIYAKPQPAADGSLVVEQNYTRVGTDQIDQLFDEALTELDGGASRALVGRADARIWAAAGSIPLYQPPQLVAVRKTVGNAGAFGFATPRYQDIGFRK